MGTKKSIRGLTLVELLVVIAIIGILIAILIPAVQAIREAARRIECSNKQKNIAVALKSFHSNNGHFPKLAYGDFYPSNGFVLEPVWSWTTRILPYMEQNAIREALNPGDDTYGNTAAFVMHEDNFSTFETTLKISPASFRCATDSPPETNTTRLFLIQGSPVRIVALATTSYVASNASGGEFIDDTNGGLEDPAGCTYGTSSVSNGTTVSGHGVFGSIREYTVMTDIDDGLSNTLLIGERAWEYGSRGNVQEGRSGLLHVSRIMNVYGYQSGIGTRDGLQFGAGDIGGTTGIGLYPDFGDKPWFASDSYSSSHPAGVNFAFADGSIRLITKSADVVTLGRLANISDAAILEEY